MIFSAAVTINDWAVLFGSWGKPGVYKILKEFKESGITRVHWRTMGGGPTAYPSEDTQSYWWTGDKLLDPATADVMKVELKEVIMDFGEFDHLAYARDLAARMGLEFYLWHEAHMESHAAQYSRFVMDHPELRAVNRWREQLAGHLSWGFAETIERRLSLLRQVMAYEPDGIALDMIKGGDNRPPAGRPARRLCHRLRTADRRSVSRQDRKRPVRDSER